MKRLCYVLAGLAVLAVSARGPGQQGPPTATDFEVTAGLGPWMILTTAYTGTNSKEMAIKLAQELREQYHLPAYVYSRVDPERAQEEERVRKLIEQQQKYLANMGGVAGDAKVYIPAGPGRPDRTWASVDDLGDSARIYVRRRRFQDTCGVFLGGYQTREAAEKEMKRVKRLPPPDPKRVPLASMDIANPVKKVLEQAYVNPFHSAFVVPNPVAKQETAGPRREYDPCLVKLNAGETYTMLHCPKRYTLAVSEFHGAGCLKPPSAGESLLEKLHLRSGESLNAAAINAHNVAELLRKLNFEAYVIHMRYYSLVTVGRFDAPDDAALKAVQHQLGKLKLDPLPMLSPPVPIEVPPELRNS
jgi:hypothetical protein